MGQRLNIEIMRKKNNKEILLANSHFHWSGYTMSAIGLALEIYTKSQEMNAEGIDSKTTERELALKLLQSTGAGIAEDEMIFLTKNESKFCKISNDRNQGLICVSENGTNQCRKWEEARVTFTVDTNNLTNTICLTVNLDCFIEYTEKELANLINAKNTKEIDFDLNNLSGDDFFKAAITLAKFYDNSIDFFKIKGTDRILTFIS